MNDLNKYIEEVKSKNDIVDVISSYIPVIQKGKNYWASCPFHHESAPSFSISRSGQFYKCFGCSVSGDVIKFVEEYETVSFQEAVNILAKRAGMQPLEFKSDKNEDFSQKREKNEKLKEILKESAKFYRSVLFSEYGKTALNYLINRGFSQKTITAFGLGYSPDFDSLPAYLNKKGFSLELAKEAGIVELNKANKYYDALYNRVIVPIISPMKEVLAFGGRTLEAKPSFAKYKNTSETTVFSKSKVIFNLNKLKEIKQKEHIPYAVMTEGYMDVMALYNAGFNYSVASMGTSLTIEQARLLKRYVDDVYICYDGDGAGQKATIRGMDILKNEGLNVRVMTMPDGLDPDEVIKLHGIERFNKAIEDAMPLIDYKLFIIGRDYDTNSINPVKREENKIQYTREAVRILSEITDNVERNKYIREISAKTGYTTDFLEGAIKLPSINELHFPQLKLNKNEKAMAFIAAAKISGRDYAGDEYYPECENGSTADKVFGYIKDAKAHGSEMKMSDLISLCKEADSLLQAIADIDISEITNGREYYNDCVRMLKKEQIDNKINYLKELLNKAEGVQQAELMKQIQELIIRKNNLMQ